MKKQVPLVDRPFRHPSEVSYSQLADWVRCPMKWFISYGLGIRPKRQHSKPRLGSMVHKALNKVMLRFYKYTDIDAVKTTISKAVDADIKKELDSLDRVSSLFSDETVLEEIKTEYAQLAIRAKKLALKTYKHFARDFEPLLVDGKVASEFHFKIDLVGLKPYHGTVDLIAKEKSTGAVWMVDWKIREIFTPDKDEEVNLQFASYQYCLHYLGIKTVGSIAYQVGATLPATPTLLKSGVALSRADIKTNWATYKKEILRHGFNPDDYMDIKAKLDKKEWFRLSRDYRSVNTMQNFFHYTVLPALENLCNEDIKISRNLYSFNCNMCSHRELCQADLRDMDVDSMINFDYTTNEYALQYREDG